MLLSGRAGKDKAGQAGLPTAGFCQLPLCCMHCQALLHVLVLIVRCQ